MEHEGAITPPSYPAPVSVAQFPVDLAVTGGQQVCCNCHDVCHKCGETADEAKAEKAEKTEEKGKEKVAKKADTKDAKNDKDSEGK